MTKPYSIKIFLPGGDPDGLRTIEKSNWSGAGIVIPRSLMAEAKQRKEITRTGIYVLVGPAEESGLPRVYIGEGDPIRPRLEQHGIKKDFWTVCIAFTSKDENLNKAHVQYIESRLVSFAMAAKRCVLDNGNTPTPATLSEADAADAEGFLAEMLLCFPVLGVNVFSVGSRTADNSTISSNRTYSISSKGVSAKGMENVEGFVVLAGSTAVQTEVASCHGYLVELRKALVDNGVLAPTGSGFTFTQDYIFASPSAAAGVIQGRNANGRIDWKNENGLTLKEIQENEIAPS